MFRMIQLLALAFLVHFGYAVEYPRSVLLGATSVGKSFLCSKVEGAKCESLLYVPGRSTTEDVTFHNHLIDTPGFFDNSMKMLISGESLTGTHAAIKKTLKEIDNHDLRVFLWVVPCTTRNIFAEEYKIMKLFEQMVGSNIPLVAVFNPGHPTNQCVMDIEGFNKGASAHGLNVRDVIHINDFDIDVLENRYTDKFRVILPDNFDDILMNAVGIEQLAEFLKEERESQCAELPAHLKDIRDRIAIARRSVRDDSAIAKVPPKPGCHHIPIPDAVDCGRQRCAEYDKSCDQFLFFKNCDTYCQRYESYTDLGCVAMNEAKQLQHGISLKQCQENQERDVAESIENRNSALRKLHEDNQKYRTEEESLLVEEENISARFASCDNRADKQLPRTK